MVALTMAALLRVTHTATPHLIDAAVIFPRQVAGKELVELTAQNFAPARD
jgi:hypothetical protein